MSLSLHTLISLQLDYVLVRFFPTLELAVKDSKPFTRA